MGNFRIAPDLALVNNNLMGAINQLKEQLAFTTLMLDSLIESMGEDKIVFINRSINSKIYRELLESKKFNDNRELQPDESLDAKLVQGDKIQKQIDLLRNELIDRFGIGFVMEAENGEDKLTWSMGKIPKV